jgi:glycerol-3-phosphate dehydrogenase
MTAAPSSELARIEDLLAPRPLPRWGAPELEALRRELLDERTEVDVVVVGAGITGAGVARDLALRGHSVLVLEQDDVAFGTSSRSTRLIHGGVRYLEQGQIGLVYEALRERAALYRLASHLVTPSRFLFPAYRGDRLAPWKLRIGLTMYDALALYRGSTHRGLSAATTLAREPLLRADALRGAVEYEDAVTDDARLTLAVLQDARRFGARVLTRAKVASITRESGGGPPHRVHLDGGGSVRTNAVVLATGPWTNETLLGESGRGLLALSKGIHVVFEASDVPVRQPLVVQVRGERRILFVVPWGTRTYVGTTDTHYEGDPGASRSDESDELEVIELASRVLNVKLDPSRVVSAWSGVRPLVRAPGRGSTVELARTHRIVTREPGVFAIVGGKLTTYRAMAQEAAELVQRRLRELHVPRALAAPRCRTLDRPLVPGAAMSESERADALLVDLWPRHGADARELATRARAKPDEEARLVPDLPYRWVEVEHALTHEGCLHVEDVLRRRLPLALTDRALGGHVARRVAERLAELRGETDPHWVEAELTRYADSVAAETRRRPSS